MKKRNTRKNASTAIYVRVSTEEQAQEGFSIRAQIEKLKSYALLKEWDIHGIYADEGISGKNIVDRPEINRLIDDINDGKVNNVLVFKVDRITRSTKNLLELVELFEENNCAFNSLCESIDTETPSGRMFLKIIGIFAEFERENISERVRLGKERMVKEGYTLANYSVSYGYTKEKGEKIQKVEPSEARIVQEIFKMYVGQNMSMTGIAKALNQRKISTKRSGVAWDTSTVKLILTNPTYIGKVRHNILDEEKYFEAEGHHEGIISEKLYYLAQERINNMPNYSRTKKPNDESYFCGVLVCGVCGSKYTTHNCSFNTDENGIKIRQTSYKCNKKNYHRDMPCINPNISHRKMDIAFMEYIQRIPDLIEGEGIDTETAAAKAEQELLKAIVDCEKQLNDLNNRKRQIMENYVGGKIEFEEYKSILGIHNEKFETLEDELNSKKAQLSKAETANVLPEDVILNLRENWHYLDNKERMMFMQRFIKKIVIEVEKERRNSNIVKIVDLEFNNANEFLVEKQQTSVLSRLKQIQISR